MIPCAKIKDYLRKFPSARILCVGDMMLDTFVYGDVDRISPEAPVPVFRFLKEQTVLGGVGNVAANLSSLGARVSLVCRIGKDAGGDRIKELLSDLSVSVHAVESAVLPTILKTRFISKNNHLMRMDREIIKAPDAVELDAALTEIEKLLETTDLVIVSDYAKGFLSRELLAKTIALCEARRIPVFVDPKGKDYSKYRGATLVKPNRKELEVVLGEAIDLNAPDFPGNIVEAGRRMLDSIGVKETIVTLSEKGMAYISGSAAPSIHIPTDAREVCDVSGAGDTTIAALAVATAVGAPIKDAMTIANIAAGIVVGKVGTAVVTPEEILRSAIRRRNGAAPFESKVFALNDLRARVKEWQSEGKRVGFTNGCFDCLHCGHLSSLFQAKEYCDKLVVAINTDSSVRKLKGPTRPIQNESTRSQVLAGLELVDAVVLFDDDTALPVVEAIRPDVIAKEGYSLDKWPEAQFVVSYGGEAVTLKRMEGYSTSNMVARMKEGTEK